MHGQEKVKTGERVRRWEPFEVFHIVQNKMDRCWWTPPMDVLKKNGNLIVKVDLPGVKREDIEVLIDDTDLIIRGKRKAECEVQEDDYYQLERAAATYYRRFALPFKVDAQEITAKLEEGVLQIEIPNPLQKKQTRQRVKVL